MMYVSNSLNKKSEIALVEARVRALRKKVDQMTLLVRKVKTRNKDLELRLYNISPRKQKNISSANNERQQILDKKIKLAETKEQISFRIFELYELLINSTKKQPFALPNIQNSKYLTPKPYQRQRNLNSPLSPGRIPITQKKSPRLLIEVPKRAKTQLNTPRGRNQEIPIVPPLSPISPTKYNSPPRIYHISPLSPKLSPAKAASRITMLRHTKRSTSPPKENNVTIPPINITNIEKLNSTFSSPINSPKSPKTVFSVITEKFDEEIPESIAQGIRDLRIENQKLNYELDQIDSDIGLLQHKKLLLEAKKDPRFKTEYAAYCVGQKSKLDEMQRKIYSARNGEHSAIKLKKKIKEKIFCLGEMIGSNNSDLIAQLHDIKTFVSTHRIFPAKQKPACVPMLDIGIATGARPRIRHRHPRVVTPGHPSVPALNLDHETAQPLSTGSEYMPRTRSTRRVFSALSKSPIGNNEKDLDTVGHLLAGCLVTKFAPLIGKAEGSLYVNEESKSDREIELPENYDILDEYKKNNHKITLTLYARDEIRKLDHNFIDFLDKRDVALKSPQTYGLLTEWIANNPATAIWILRDYVMGVNTNAFEVDALADLFFGYYESIQARVLKKPSEDSIDAICGCAAVLSAFYEKSTSKISKSKLNNVITIDFTNIIEILFRSVLKTKPEKFRNNFLCLLKLAKFIPVQFLSLAQLNGGTSSFILRFIDENNEYKTVISACCDFFIAVRPFLDEDSLRWSIAYFFNQTSLEFYQRPIREEILTKYLEVLTSIIANRTQGITEQLQNLNFLQFAIKQIELEEFVQISRNLSKIAALSVQPSKTLGRISNIKSSNHLPKLNLTIMNMESPKLQIQINQQQPQTTTRSSVSISDSEYVNQRRKLPVYVSVNLHVQFVQMLFALLIDHTLHRLDTSFVDPFPHVNRKPNVLYTVMRHMENIFNQDIAKPLFDAFTPDAIEDEISEMTSAEEPLVLDRVELSKKKINCRSSNRLIPKTPGEEKRNKKEETSARLRLQMFQSVPNFIALQSGQSSSRVSLGYSFAPSGTSEQRRMQYGDYKRLLRLSAPELFDASRYAGGQHIASGAFGAVMRATVKGETLAVKVLQKSRTEFDNPHLYETFTEVSILEMCRGDRRVTQLRDYGCTADSYFIVMEFYPTTLRAWRKSDGEKPLKTMLRLYREFLSAATVLSERRINHYDIKCDNVMLDRGGRPALADFGESMCYDSDRNCVTRQNKGTEWIKSPEMLSIAINSIVTDQNYDRRRRVGAGPASDVWSIGCLFFELLTGEYLFVDSDWSRFFYRVTNPKQPLIRPEDREKLPKDVRIEGFLTFVLQRSARRRPNLQQVITKFDEIFPDANSGELPRFYSRK